MEIYVIRRMDNGWVLVGVKFLHDWKPDLIPGPKEMGLFKIWGIV